MAKRMRIGAQLGAAGLADIAAALQPLVLHRCVEVRGHRCGKTIAVVLAGEHRLHWPAEQVQAQPGGEIALRLLAVAVAWQRARWQAVLFAERGQAGIVQHRHRRLRKARTQPAFTAGSAVAGKARLRPADHQQLPAVRGGEVDQVLMAAVQWAELAHHQTALDALRQRHQRSLPRHASACANGAAPPAR